MAPGAESSVRATRATGHTAQPGSQTVPHRFRDAAFIPTQGSRLGLRLERTVSRVPQWGWTCSRPQAQNPALYYSCVVSLCSGSAGPGRQQDSVMRLEFSAGMWQGPHEPPAPGSSRRSWLGHLCCFKPPPAATVATLPHAGSPPMSYVQCRVDAQGPQPAGPAGYSTTAGAPDLTGAGAGGAPRGIRVGLPCTWLSTLGLHSPPPPR